MMVEVLVAIAALLGAINLVLLLRKSGDSRDLAPMPRPTRAEPAVAPQLARIESRLAAIEGALAEGRSAAPPSAPAADARLDALDARFDEVLRKLDALSLLEQRIDAGQGASNRPYELAQRLARQGATVDQIVGASGLGHREAELILRLHAGSGER